MHKLTRLAMLAVVVASATGAALLLAVRQAARQAPAFYTQALAVQPAVQKFAGQQLEQSVLALHNQARRPGQWSARFTEEEINGWLATELPAKFSQALPPGVAEPRVSLERRRLQVALRFTKGQVDAVLSLAADVFLTTEANEVAVRIDRLRAGALPLPLKDLQDEVAERAGQAGVRLHWTEIDGDPTAIVKLPLAFGQQHQSRLIIEAIDLADGELLVSGRTEREEPAALPVAQAKESEIRQR